MKAVVGLREKLGIGDGDLETGHVSVRREYERGERGERGDFKHFLVTRGVTIRQRDLKRLDEYLDALVSSAEMEVSFSFTISRLHEVRAETRLKALREARKKAAAMASAAGAKLGKVLTINEHRPGRGSQFAESNNQSYFHISPTVDLSSDKFVPGPINVRVSVYATFALE